MSRATSSLTPILTPALLHTLRTHPQLPPHTWYFITGVTLSMVNRPDEIGTVLKHALQPFQRQQQQTLSKSSSSSSLASLSSSSSMHWERRQGGAEEVEKAKEESSALEESGRNEGLEEQLTVTRRMREALLKCSVVGGLPKTINALFSLKSATPPFLLDPPLGRSPSGRPAELYDTPSSAILQRGQRFFERTYGKVAKRVMGQLDRSGTEDLGLLARLQYGYVVSNTSVLNAAENSFVLLAGLIPQDVNPQLKGHLEGAINNGATVEQVRAVREVVIRICEASGMTRLDQPSSMPASSAGEEGRGGWGWRAEVANL